MQLGPIRRQPARANSIDQRRFARAALGAALAEAGADDADRADALGDAIVDGGQHVRGGNDDDGEVDRSGNVADARIGA